MAQVETTVIVFGYTIHMIVPKIAEKHGILRHCACGHLCEIVRNFSEKRCLKKIISILL